MRTVTYFLVAAAFLGLALFVVRRRPSDGVTRSFALFALGLAGWVCGIGGLHTGAHATAWGRLTFASASLIPAAFLSFAWAYPRPSRWPGAGLRRSVWAVALGFGLLSLTTRLVLSDPGGVTPRGLTREPGPLYPCFAAYFLVAAIIGLGVFIVKWRRARGAERVQLQYLGLGLLIATAGCVTLNLLIPLTTGQSAWSGVGPVFVLPFLVLVAHGIIRHRLLDLRVVLRRSVAFAAVIAGAWFASVEALRLAQALPSDPVSAPVGIALFVGIVAIVLSAPVAPRLARLLDRYLLRSRLDFDRALQEATRKLSRPLTPEEFTTALIGVLESALVPNWLLVLTRPSDRGPHHVAFGGGFEAPAACHDEAFLAAAWSVPSRVPAVRVLMGAPDVGPTSRDPEDVLRAAGGEVWIGLGRHMQRHGATILGPRASGEPYFAPAVRFLEDLAKVASMALDIAAYVAERQRTEAMLSIGCDVLKMIATGSSQAAVLTALCEAVEVQFEGMLCAVMLAEPDGRRLRCGAAPSLPLEFARALDGLPIGPHAACCGTAAYLKKPVVAPDIANDPLWDDYRDAAIAHRLLACWSMPVVAADGSTLGTFAMYFREPGTPGEGEQGVLERAAHMVGMTLERVRAEEALRQTEEQLRHAQRIEALGQLAGGVAHDFNNLLTVIAGRAEVARRKLEHASPIREDIDLIHKTAERAGALTQQLLAFGRQQVLEQRILDPAVIVSGLAPMLHRVIGEHIDLKIELSATAGYVKADPAQIEQVVLNLVVNARDAMPRGGVVRLSVDRSEVGDPSAPRAAGSHRGRHVRIQVTDTGCGMSAETRAHLFEPFFTTKERGRGAGLGLATVYGIVRQHEGHITAESEPGCGSTFSVYLPSVRGVASAAQTDVAP